MMRGLVLVSISEERYCVREYARHLIYPISGLLHSCQPGTYIDNCNTSLHTLSIPPDRVLFRESDGRYYKVMLLVNTASLNASEVGTPQPLTIMATRDQKA